MRTKLLALSFVLVVLSGCGSGGGGEEPSTLAEALGIGDEEAMRERERKVQEAIAACMQDEGFEYVPMDPSGMRFAVGVGPGGRRMADDMRREVGYGVTIEPERREGAEPPGGQDDPNAAIREALSEDQREAYDRALYGSLVPGEGGEVEVRVGPGGGMSDSEGNPVEGGCLQKAQREVRGPGFDEETGRALRDLGERIQNDPRMVEAQRAWQDCMVDAGFRYEDTEDIIEDLEQRLEAVEAEGNETALATLQEEELAIAAADEECYEEHVADVEPEVREEYEQEFLDENPDLARG